VAVDNARQGNLQGIVGAANASLTFAGGVSSDLGNQDLANNLAQVQREMNAVNRGTAIPLPVLLRASN
jgi:hypothetical protein